MTRIHQLFGLGIRRAQTMAMAWSCASVGLLLRSPIMGRRILKFPGSDQDDERAAPSRWGSTACRLRTDREVAGVKLRGVISARQFPLSTWL